MTDQVNENQEQQQEGSIFKQPAKVEDQKTTPDDGVKTSQPDINAIFNDQLNSITDDTGKQKYNDVITALEALKHTQAHIKTLQEENKKFRESQLEKDTLDTAFANIAAKKEPEKTRSEGIDAEKVKGMTLEAIREYEANKVRDANQQAVSDALIKQYGDLEKAKAAYAAKAVELGVDQNLLVDLAGRSPKAVLSYFSTDKTSAFNSTRGSVNTQALAGKSEENIDYAARFLNVNNPSISKWKDAGKDLK